MAHNDTLGSFGRGASPSMREAMRMEKDDRKKAMERSNAKDIDELESYIRHITTFHHETIDGIDWEGLLRRSPGVNRKTSAAGHGAHVMDEHEAWAAIQAGDDTVIMSIIKSRQTLSHHHKLAKGLGFSVQEGFVHAVANLHSPEIVPEFQFKFTPSGRLTEMKMPKERHMAIYRAYAGSVALKIASDLFKLVPRDKIAVSCVSRCILPGMDQTDDWPVLSVVFGKNKFDLLDMTRTDPVAGLSLFERRERWHPINGFSGIAPLVDIPAGMAI